MRAALVTALAAALVGCGASAGAPGDVGATKLTIRYWAEGPGSPEQRWTLSCRPAGGTHPRPASACRKLLALKAPFAPIPPGAMCTEQYGGPQVAVVSGTLRGKRVWAKLQSRNGCEISRFERLAFLVPGFGTGSSA